MTTTNDVDSRHSMVHMFASKHPTIIVCLLLNKSSNISNKLVALYHKVLSRSFVGSHVCYELKDITCGTPFK